MEQKEKQLLLADLCARLPYGVICDRLGKHYPLIDIDIKRELVYLLRDDTYVPYNILRGDIIKPYLRPMSSMTEEETDEYLKTMIWSQDIKGLAPNVRISTVDSFDWLNSHHFDYRGLIEKGLSIEAPEGMYVEQLKEK